MKNKFVVFSVILFAVILAAGSLAFMFSMQQINLANKGEELLRILELERHKLEAEVNSDIAIVLKMASSPVLKQYFLDPEDPETAETALKDFEGYRDIFASAELFWVIDSNKEFFLDFEFIYIVDPDDPWLYWYNMTMYETDKYNFNIDYDPTLNITYIWINAPVYDDFGDPIGILGIGVNLSDFVNAIYENYVGGAELYFFNVFGEVTGAKDVDLVAAKVQIDDIFNNGIMDIARNLEPGSTYAYHSNAGAVAVGTVPALEWYTVAFLPDSIEDYYTAMTGLFLVVLVLILFIIIIFNIVISKYLKSLNKTMDSLEIASKAKSEFLATMSHEIRTPLNAVIGFSEIELLGDLNDYSKENIRQINQSGTTLLGIIGDILDISKIEAGKFELEPAEYETASLLSDALHLNMVRIGSKPIDFILEISGDFPARLVGDELRIKQILNNLLSNAIKYTDEGTVTLKIQWENLGDEARLRFSVEDTGIGIRKEDMGKLFESYTQLDSGTSRKIEGTGLGLTITKTIAEMMGGSVSVESEHGKGTVFSAEIVQKYPEPGTEKPASIGEETAESLRNFRYEIDETPENIDRPFLPGSKVLVVDDNVANLRVARGMLAPYGLSVDTAVSGREAIEKIRSAGTGFGRYDLILMDHMMPEMDGIETAEAIHGIESVPIVALTANALRGMREHYVEQGFVDYLSKPLRPRALNDVIVKWIPVKMTEFQRVDKLNHFLLAFNSGKEIEPVYFQRFVALMNSVDLEGAAPDIKETADLITFAAKKEDPEKIRELLPGFCEFLRKRQTDMFAGRSDVSQAGSEKIPGEFLQRLKKAILNGDSKTAITILTELGDMGLDPAGRELYFILHDLLSEGRIDRAIDALYFWERFDK